MNFGEKLKSLREEKGLTQSELAHEIGTTLKTISNYETKGTKPRYMSRYQEIADFFDVNVNYLLTDEEAFIINARKEYGSKGAKDAEKLLNDMVSLFAGGELPQEDKDAMFHALQEVYWKVKVENKKYTPKKYLDNNSKSK